MLKRNKHDYGDVHVHGLVYDGRFQVVEDVVVVFMPLSIFHQGHELLLQDLPTDLDAFHPQLILRPLLQLDVDGCVKST